MQLPNKIKSQQSWREKSANYKSKSYSSAPSRRETPGKKRKPLRLKNWKEYLIAVVTNRTFLVTAGVSLVVMIAIAVSVIAWVSRGLPDPNRLIERQIAQSTKIYDRTGEHVLYEVSGDERRTLVNLDDIPLHLRQATVVIEDRDFYNHGGISYWAIFRTAITNVIYNRRAGGSTLTQQFVKNSLFTAEKKYTRKLKEAIMAVKLEKVFTKDEILQMYLNEIPYGSNAYGVEAASQLYFGKHVQEINLPEAAVLAALPQSPSRYSPYGSNKDFLLGRQAYILDQMAKAGHISKEEAEVAKNVKLTFREPAANITAPHFVMYVKEYLEDKYGVAAVEQDGLKIITTLDLYKQGIGEKTLDDYAETNKKISASNSALLSLDPKTGQILAMVGSRDYFNDEIDGQVNITTSKRQPGSSMKPIVYAASFMKGYTPDTVLYDVLTNFSTDPANKYEPHNYNGKEYGPVSIRKALAGSLNIPAVKALYLVGINNMIDLLKDLNYTTFNEKDRFGLALVLGGGEVKMIEHVNAFSAFAREGNLHPVTAILRIEDRNGKVLEEFKEDKGKKIFDVQIARMVNDILSDNGARAYIFGDRGPLTLGKRPVAAKTGTTNDYRDAWTIGYTPSLVTGVWVGNNDNSEMKKGAAASMISAPIWHDYMDKVLGDTPIEFFKKPDPYFTGKDILDGKNVGEITVKVDKISGLLATDSTPPEYIEERKYRQDHSILYYVDKNDPRGKAPANPSADPQFNLWESRVLAWAEKQGYATSTPPTETDNVHKDENKPQVTLITPGDNDTISSVFLNARIEATAPRGINRAEYYVNGNLLAANHSFPFNLEKTIEFLPNGIHTLTVRVCDDVSNCTEKKVDINFTAGKGQADSGFNIAWLSPVNGSEIATTTFPSVAKLNLSQPTNVAKVQIHSLDASNRSTLIASQAMPSGDLVELNWINPPAPGEYRLYGVAIGWTGQTAETEKVTVKVK